MQPIVAHLTSKMGGATDTFFATIKAQKPSEAQYGYYNCKQTLRT